MILTPEKTTHEYSILTLRRLFAAELKVAPEALAVSVSSSASKITVVVDHTYRTPTFSGRD